MEPLLDYIEESPRLSDKEILFKIWTSPRIVFRYLNAYAYDKYVIILLILNGINRSFSRASSTHSGDNLSLISVILLCILLGGMLGWLSYFIYAALLSWTGKWLGGKANTPALLRVIAYGSIPTALSLVFIIPLIGLFGEALFKSDGQIITDDIPLNILFFVLVGTEMLLGLYNVVLVVIGLSEVQQLSIGKALLNALLPLVIIVVPLVLLLLLVK